MERIEVNNNPTGEELQALWDCGGEFITHCAHKPGARGHHELVFPDEASMSAYLARLLDLRVAEHFASELLDSPAMQKQIEVLAAHRKARLAEVEKVRGPMPKIIRW